MKTCENLTERCVGNKIFSELHSLKLATTLLKLTAKAPDNRSKSKRKPDRKFQPSSLSGDILVSGRVESTPKLLDGFVDVSSLPFGARFQVPAVIIFSGV